MQTPVHFWAVHPFFKVCWNIWFEAEHATKVQFQSQVNRPCKRAGTSNTTLIKESGSIQIYNLHTSTMNPSMTTKQRVRFVLFLWVMWSQRRQIVENTKRYVCVSLWNSARKELNHCDQQLYYYGFISLKKKYLICQFVLFQIHLRWSFLVTVFCEPYIFDFTNSNMTIDNKWFHIHKVSDRENISSIISRQIVSISYTLMFWSG